MTDNGYMAFEIPNPHKDRLEQALRCLAAVHDDLEFVIGEQASLDIPASLRGIQKIIYRHLIAEGIDPVEAN